MASPSSDEPTHWMTAAGQQVGPEPFSIVAQRVEAGQIPGSTLVWWATASGWATYEEVTGSGTPPAPLEPPAPPAAPAASSAWSSPGSETTWSSDPQPAQHQAPADTGWQSPRDLESSAFTPAASTTPTGATPDAPVFSSPSIFEPDTQETFSSQPPVFEPDRSAAADTWSADLPPGPSDVVASAPTPPAEAYEAPVVDPVQPAAYEPQPAQYEPQPAQYEPQPAQYEPQPAQYEPQPAQSEPQPAQYEPQPAQYEPQPAQYEPQPEPAPIAPAPSAGVDPDTAAAFTALVERSVDLHRRTSAERTGNDALVAAVVAALVDRGFVLIDLATESERTRLRFEEPGSEARVGVALTPISTGTDGGPRCAALTVSFTERNDRAGDVGETLRRDATSEFAQSVEPGTIGFDADPMAGLLTADIDLLVELSGYIDDNGVADHTAVNRDITAIVHSLRSFIRGRFDS